MAVKRSKVVKSYIIPTLTLYSTAQLKEDELSYFISRSEAMSINAGILLKTIVLSMVTVREVPFLINLVV